MNTLSIRLVLLFFCTVSLVHELNGQGNLFSKLMVSPEISVGYTFQGNINFGMNIDAGFSRPSNPHLIYGGSYNFRLMRFDRKWQKHHSINMFYQDRIVDFKLGIGRTSVNHGFRRANKCIVFGMVTDLSVKYPHFLSPKIGINSFFIDTWKWRFFPSNYHTIYVGYDYQLQPIQ